MAVNNITHLRMRRIANYVAGLLCYLAHMRQWGCSCTLWPGSLRQAAMRMLRSVLSQHTLRHVLMIMDETAEGMRKHARTLSSAASLRLSLANLMTVHLPLMASTRFAPGQSSGPAWKRVRLFIMPGFAHMPSSEGASSRVLLRSCCCHSDDTIALGNSFCERHGHQEQSPGKG